MLDNLFADLLKRHTLTEIYELDILEFLRLINRSNNKMQESRKTDSLFTAFGK